MFKKLAPRLRKMTFDAIESGCRNGGRRPPAAHGAPRYQGSTPVLRSLETETFHLHNVTPRTFPQIRDIWGVQQNQNRGGGNNNNPLQQFFQPSGRRRGQGGGGRPGGAAISPVARGVLAKTTGRTP